MGQTLSEFGPGVNAPQVARADYNRRMGESAEARAILDAVACLSPKTAFVTLSEEYLRAVERVEALPSNRSGADKAWVPRLVDDTLRMRRTARRRR